MRAPRPLGAAVFGGLAVATIIALLASPRLPERDSPGPPAQALATPAQVDHWENFSSAKVSEDIARLSTTYGSAMPSGVTPVARGYRRDTGERVLVIGFNVKPGTTGAKQLSSYDHVLKAVLSDAGVPDAIYPTTGSLGGEMACGDSMLAMPTTLCIWVGRTVIASVTFIGSTPDNDIAARLSRELLASLLAPESVEA